MYQELKKKHPCLRNPANTNVHRFHAQPPGGHFEFPILAKLHPHDSSHTKQHAHLMYKQYDLFCSNHGDEEENVLFFIQ
jgi:hypothetical protein